MANESNTEIQTTQDLDNLTFGVEIETVNLGITGAANAIHRVVGGTVNNSFYGNASVTDREGRKWNVVPDGSISGPNAAEIVTPPLRHSNDMSILQAVVRELRSAGARVNQSCGIHIHVGYNTMGDTEEKRVKALRNLCNLTYKNEAHINTAIGCGYTRQAQWAKPLPTSFIDGIKKAKTLDEILAHYYDKCGSNPEGRDMFTYSRVTPGGYGMYGHYCNARYSGLNLHNLKYRTGNTRTVEFRLFDASLHAGKIRAYVTLCLALVARAKRVARTTTARREGAQTTMAREQMRWFMSKLLGLVGDRYDTVREFCCDTHFDVDAGRRAVAAARNGAGYSQAA